MMVLLAMIGCQESTLTALPAEIVWGDVDFSLSAPSDGYDPQSVVVRNTGEKTVKAEIQSFDFELLCLSGFTELPVELGELEPDNEFILTIGVCNYNEEGGRDIMVEGSIEVGYDNETLDIPWSFTPVFNIGNDSG
ncbi:MAG: hypothetical protein ACON4U_05770 [Myxococcota bacterium]